MKQKYFCAVDLGAGSGRLILASLQNQKLDLHEVHRFDGYLVSEDERYRWDVDMIYREICTGLSKIDPSINVTAIGIDTWGVDFVTLDEDGALIEAPIAYRDSRTDGLIELLEQTISKEELYKITGIQFLQFNTIYQLLAIKLKQKELFEKTRQCLMMPDYLAFLFSGVKSTEYTIASTSDLLDVRAMDWSEPLFSQIGMKPDIFPPVHQPGKILGDLKLSEDKKALAHTKFVSVGSHDTASAIAAVPADAKDWIYISSGTWSLMGIEAMQPIATDMALKNNFTNEGGVYGTYRFLKNIMGLWLIQRLRTELNPDKSFTDIMIDAAEIKPFQKFINVDHKNFLNPNSMVSAIDQYLEKTQQEQPQSTDNYFRLVFDCLALKYYEVYRSLCEMTGRDFSAVHVIGGGSQNTLLCQLTATLLGKNVFAGPVEGTAIGNILVQAIAMGEIKNLKAGRIIVKNSFKIKEYLPQPMDNFKTIYGRYCSKHIID